MSARRLTWDVGAAEYGSATLAGRRGRCAGPSFDRAALARVGGKAA
jgi:hypothetical protein